MEPIISGDRDINTINRLGVFQHFVVDADGFAGGIWLLWKLEDINLQVIKCSQHTITVIIHQPQHKWLFTAVYASPQYHTRHQLWTYLDGVQPITPLPWLVDGDFNEIISLSEKKGSLAPLRSPGFASWITRNARVDLGILMQTILGVKVLKAKVVWE